MSRCIWAQLDEEARRKAIYDGIYQSPLCTMAMVNRLIDELKIIEEFQKKEKCQQQLKLKSKNWISPGSGRCKINADAAVNHAAYKGSVGVVCRDDHGGFIAARALVFSNITESETLEAMACSEALALAEYCGLRKITVASDCLSVIKNIKEMTRCPYMMIIQDINVRSRYFDFVRFAHEGRECNWEAHYLARHARTLEPGRYLWLGTPVFLDVNIVNHI